MHQTIHTCSRHFKHAASEGSVKTRFIIQAGNFLRRCFHPAVSTRCLSRRARETDGRIENTRACVHTNACKGGRGRERERERESERERATEGGGLRGIEMLRSSGSISKYPSRDPVSRRVSGDRLYGAASRPRGSWSPRPGPRLPCIVPGADRRAR